MTPSEPALLAEMPAVVPWFLVAVGLFSVAGGVFGWDWFLNSRKAWIWVKLFGVMGARVFYVVLGLAVAGLGVMIGTGLLPSGR